MLLPGCEGRIGGGDGGREEPEVPQLPNDPSAIAAACEATGGVLHVGLTRLRRLTRDQMNNALRDLLGVEGRPADALAPDERMGPFHSNAIAPVTELLVQQAAELAARAASEAEGRMDLIAPCSLTDDEGTTCATELVERLGQRAYRRPLGADEIQGLVSLYELGRRSGGASRGFRLVIEGLLQSPSFLYHADVGESGVPSATPEPMDGHGLASRLSFFLWNSIPDTELVDLAADSSLLERDVLAGQVDRMLQDPRAGATIALFHRQWLGLSELPRAQKDNALFPEFNEEMADAMLNESARFTDHVVRQGDGLLRTLLGADYTFPEGPLFDLYDIEPPDGFTPGDRVSLDPSRRAGILTQAAFLARWSHHNQTSPIHRGIVVRENLMCQPLSPPPANVANVPPPVDDVTSTRERFAQHVADPGCAGCHQFIDPIGLGFEHYDAIGKYRATDGLGEVNAAGEITSAREDLAGPYYGGVELARKLAGSAEVAECVANQWFRFALGRIESLDDACSIQAIHEDFKASGGNIRTLLSQVALSDAFRHVRLTASEE
ncbi:DUF1592 domain-containing protein [Sorangium sp. So ce1097]|uniref:DUF1592 domain-containing protein n=1 Tax=Sorangium sp. So ce1097 TaxID=3133330 RepID=UPI003F61072D